MGRRQARVSSLENGQLELSLRTSQETDFRSVMARSRRVQGVRFSGLRKVAKSISREGLENSNSREVRAWGYSRSDQWQARDC
jgi:hypothetical protein